MSNDSPTITPEMVKKAMDKMDELLLNRDQNVWKDACEIARTSIAHEILEAAFKKKKEYRFSIAVTGGVIDADSISKEDLYRRFGFAKEAEEALKNSERYTYDLGGGIKYHISKAL